MKRRLDESVHASCDARANTVALPTALRENFK
jgi:hypothetical protein